MTKPRTQSANAREHHRTSTVSPYAEKGLRREYVAPARAIPKDQFTNLPAAPCFRCGDRGWCSHRQEGSL